MVKVIFVQPFTLNADLAAQCEGRTIVLDVAFNAGSPQGKGTAVEQFFATTMDFITALGSRLVLWLDHHDHEAWKTIFSHDPRFVLIPREDAAACPPLITRDLYNRYGEADTIVCHGDFDGIISAIKYTMGGDSPYYEADSDSIAIDSRIGEPSVTGFYLDEALKADLRDDRIRQAIYDEYTTLNPVIFAHAKSIVDDAYIRYETIKRTTLTLQRSFVLQRNVAIVDASTSGSFDLTQLLLAGQKIGDVALVRHTQNGEAQWTLAGPARFDFRKAFGLTGGMPNRVNLSGSLSQETILEILR